MLVELTTAKTYLSITTSTYDALLTMLLECAISFAETYCNNKFEATNITQYFDGDDSILDGIFYLNNIVNITDLKFYEDINGTFVLIPSTDYTLDETKGIVYFKNAVMAGNHNYKAEFSCGSATITADLKLAILKITGKYFNKHKSDGLQSESLDGASLNFDEFLSQDIKMILDKYKILVI